MTLPRRAFLASLIAAPFTPKFSLPTPVAAAPTFVYSYPFPMAFVHMVTVGDCGGLISKTEYNRDGSVKSYWHRDGVNA